MMDFASLLDSQLKSYRRGFNPGDTVKARVVTVGEEYVTLDVNAKSVAIARMIVLIVFSFATPVEWKLESLLL